MTSLTLINMHHNAKKAESTNEEILELIGELIKEGFPKKVTIDEISDIADRHFNDIRSILSENKSSSNPIKKLFLKKELQDGLKHLFLIKCKEALGVRIESDDITTPSKHVLKDLTADINSLGKKELDDFYKIFDQYGKTIKDQDSKSISVFKAIQLFFQEMITKLKSKNLEDFNNKHTVKVDNATFYNDALIQKESKQEVNEPDREITYPEEVLEEEVSKSPALETIVEEDENLVNNATKAASKIAQEKIVPKTTKQLVKPLIPEKSQKVIDAGNKIRGSQKTETPSYTSSCTINLKSAGEKPKIAPKPTVKVDTKQYGTKVEKLKGKHERFIELASRSSIEQVVSSKGR